MAKPTKSYLMKLIIYFLLISSCSTYVPVTYRKATESTLPQGSTLKVVITKDTVIPDGDKAVIRESLSSLFVEDEWFMIKNGEEKSDYELLLESYILQGATVSSTEYTQQDENRRVTRSASALAEGQSRISLFDIKNQTKKDFLVSSQGRATSEITLPKETNTKALFSVIGLMMGYDRVEDARRRQDEEVTYSAERKLSKNLNLAIMRKISPQIVTERIEIDDKEDDIKSLVTFINKNDLDAAYHYLTERTKESPRADIIYNLGALSEAKGKGLESCSFYQKAYEDKRKDLYLKQHSACLSRYNQKKLDSL
jgi:hypothetical protein